MEKLKMEFGDETIMKKVIKYERKLLKFHLIMKALGKTSRKRRI
jgi:hypothetical protein